MILVLMSVQRGSAVFSVAKWRLGAPCRQPAIRGLYKKTLVFGLHCPLVAALSFGQLQPALPGLSPRGISQNCR